jgi:hypothetical protein
MPRRRKPLELHRIEGTYRRYRHDARHELDAGGDLQTLSPRPISALQRQQSRAKSYSWRHRMC